MAKARICDRCGITVTDHFYTFITYIVTIPNNSRYETNDIKNFELCEDCMKELKNFIEKQEPQINESDK